MRRIMIVALCASLAACATTPPPVEPPKAGVTSYVAPDALRGSADVETIATALATALPRLLPPGQISGTLRIDAPPGEDPQGLGAALGQALERTGYRISAGGDAQHAVAYQATTLRSDVLATIAVDGRGRAGILLRRARGTLAPSSTTMMQVRG